MFLLNKNKLRELFIYLGRFPISVPCMNVNHLNFTMCTNLMNNILTSLPIVTSDSINYISESVNNTD